MKALVTGVAGFIGSTLAAPAARRRPRRRRRGLAHRLLRPGAQAGEPARLEHPRLRLVRGRPERRSTSRRCWPTSTSSSTRPASPACARRGGRDFDRYARDNVCATQRLLEAALRAPRLRRFVYASSSSVYGNAERYPTEETDRPQPLSPYGVTKLAAEHLCGLYAAQLRPADGVAALLHRLRSAAAARTWPSPASAAAVRDGAEIAVYGDRRPDPRLHLRRRRRGGQRAGRRPPTSRRAPCSTSRAARRPRSTRSSSCSARSPARSRPITEARRFPGTSCGRAAAPHAIRAAIGWTPAVPLRRGSRSSTDGPLPSRPSGDARPRDRPRTQ